MVSWPTASPAPPSRTSWHSPSRSSVVNHARVGSSARICGCGGGSISGSVSESAAGSVARHSANGRLRACAAAAACAPGRTCGGPYPSVSRDNPPAQVLGDETYESLARRGEQMTTAAMVTYALDQIDQARAELNAVSK